MGSDPDFDRVRHTIKRRLHRFALWAPFAGLPILALLALLEQTLPKPHPAPADTSSGVGDLLPTVGVIVLILIGIAVLAGAGVAASRHISSRRAARESLANRLAQANEVHGDVLAEYTKVEIDPITLLDMPELLNVTNPVTRAFHDAMAEAWDAADRAETSKSADDIEAFATAARTMRRRWDDARHHATAVGHRNLSDGDSKSVRRAQMLLRTATDSAATAAERENAYQRAAAKLEGICVLPRKALAAIETQVRPVLETKPTPSTPEYTT